MLKYMEELSQTEALNIRKTIQELFRNTCILQVKYDPVTLTEKDNPRYRICARNQEFISDYLAVLDCELIHDPQEHIFRISGEGVPAEKMSLMTTRIMILLKLLYREKIMGEGLKATVTCMREIREYGWNTGLITRKLTVTEWQEAFVQLKTHQVIELPVAAGNVEDETPIYIYNTVNIFCSTAMIGELVEQYKSRESKEEEEKSGEAGEKDLYQNVSE